MLSSKRSKVPTVAKSRKSHQHVLEEMKTTQDGGKVKPVLEFLLECPVVEVDEDRQAAFVKGVKEDNTLKEVVF